MKIYLARPISGCIYDIVIQYYNKYNKIFSTFGYDVLHPCVGSDFINSECNGGTNNEASNHAIKERDKWMVTNADVVYVNLEKTSIVSIGCVSELAWGDLLGKHTVVVMEKSNIHRHAFVLEMADVVFETEDEAMAYLKKLVSREI
jgi:hypothetical protein